MIFGNFQDIQMPDIVSFVGRQTGRFHVSGHPVLDRVDMFFAEGRLLALSVQDQWVPDVLRVRDCVIELLSRQEGEFHFECGSLPPCGTLYQLAVEHLLLASMAAIDEIESFRRELPSARTYFRVIQQNVGWLDPDLALFWEVAGRALQTGTNAFSLAATAGMSVDRVCLCLYKLRLAGWIAPIRHGTRTITPWVPARPVAVAASEPAVPSPAWMVSTANPMPAVSPAFVPGNSLHESHSRDDEVVPVDLRHVQVKRPSAGVVRGLMKRLALVLGRENA